MYVLERLHTAGRRRRWITYAICGNAQSLERVRKGLPPMEQWRITRKEGSCEQHLRMRRYEKAASRRRMAG